MARAVLAPKPITSDGQYPITQFATIVEPPQERIKELDQILADLQESSLPAEQAAMAKLAEERKGLAAQLAYPQLDLSFLMLHNALKVNIMETDLTTRASSVELDVPRFGVYSAFGQNTFTVRFNESVLEGQPRLKFGDHPSGISVHIGNPEPRIPNEYYVVTVDLPRIFSNPLLFAFEYYRLMDRKNETAWARYNSLPQAVKAKYAQLTRIELESRFDAVIPKGTKQAMQEAKGIFGNNIFFIAETRPEQWEVRVRTEPAIYYADPLAVGVVGEACYLIDHFDVTPAERRVVETTHEVPSIQVKRPKQWRDFGGEF